MMNNSIALLQRALVAVSVIGSAAAVMAGPFAGSSSGVFVNPILQPSAVFLGGGTSTVLWGDTSAFGGPQNQLSFSGTTFSDIPTETSFQVGSLYYYNGTIAVDSGIDGVDLKLTLGFTDPSGITQAFNYPLGIVNTPNGGSAEDNADYVVLPTVPSTTFTYNGITYTLHVSFGQFVGGGFLVGNQFHVYEDNSATAPIFGKITTDLTGLPDGGSMMLLVGAGFAGLAALRRKVS